MATALIKFDVFTEDLLKGVHNFAGHVFKAALSNVAPVVGNTVLANITQVANTGGYAAGGYLLDSVALSRTGAAAKVTIADETITAAGGSVGPARYVVVYNDTAAGKPLVGFYDRGASLTLLDTEEWLLDFNATTGAFTLA